MAGWRDELVIGQVEAALSGTDEALVVHGDPIDACLEWQSGDGLTVGIRAGDEDDVQVEDEGAVDAQLVANGIDPHDGWRVL